MPSIYDDPDVDAIYSKEPVTSAGQSTRALLISQLNPTDAELARTYFTGHAAMYNAEFSLDSCVADLIAGVRTVDGFSGAAPAGWRKCIVFEMSKALDQLYYEHQRHDEAQAFAEWMAWTIEELGWPTDEGDQLTALGERHQECLSIWLTVGPRPDAETGEFLPPAPSHARRLVE